MTDEVTITITKKLYERLEKLANGVFDTPNNVIERELGKEDKIISPLEHKATFISSNTLKGKITHDHIVAVYSSVNDILKAFEKEGTDERLALNNACDYLATESIGMNRGSASIYLKSLIAMKQGKIYKNKMSFNNQAADYFLGKILEDDGKKGLRAALDSFSGYIKYREKLVSGKMVVFRNIRDKYQAKLKE